MSLFEATYKSVPKFTLLPSHLQDGALAAGPDTGWAHPAQHNPAPDAFWATGSGAPGHCRGTPGKRRSLPHPRPKCLEQPFPDTWGPQTDTSTWSTSGPDDQHRPALPPCHVKK